MKIITFLNREFRRSQYQQFSRCQQDIKPPGKSIVIIRDKRAGEVAEKASGKKFFLSPAPPSFFIFHLLAILHFPEWIWDIE